MTKEVAGLPLIKAFKSDLFPLDRLDPGSDVVAVLSKILVTEAEQEVFDPGPGGRFELGLTVAEEVSFNLIGLEGFALVLGGASTTSLRLGASFTPDRWEVLLGAGARLRFPRNVLKPVMRQGDAWVDDPSRTFAELDISAGIIIDSDWNVEFDGANAFHLDPAMIADSGLVIEGDVALDFSDTNSLPESAALGLPPTWKGVVFRSLRVYLPDAITEAVPIASLSFTNFHIGSGGVSGSIALNGTPGEGTIGGFPFRPTKLEVELLQNCLLKVEIEGELTLSFFDEPLDVTAGFDLDGNFTVAVAAESGIATLNKPGILEVSLDGIRFAREDGVFLVGISGTITPLIGGLDWPGFKAEELSIDSLGNVRLKGGWLNLPNQYSLDFYGFHVGISRLGMGSTDDGGRWIGFSGNIKLVDGLSIGGSVDGLRVTWYDDGRPANVTLEGVGVELEIPEVLRFKGAVSYYELPGPQRRFDGDITLELLALDLRIDGKIVIGTDTSAEGAQYTFFALYIGVELPAGIPLWATGLGLYGIAGLVAIQMAPNKGAEPNALHPTSQPDEEWFENLDGSDGWYKRPTKGVTDLRSKWDPIEGGFALGGGVTIGTLPDNGFTFNGSLLLVISFPGPVILLEGKANMLKPRAALTDDALFRALVVLDFRAGEFLVGLDAKYKFGDGGELIEITGSAEAFFDFNDASRWHLYLGRKDPRERRIRAQILSLFESNSYLMIDANMLQTGAFVGYDKQWSFGPLRVVIEAWIEGGVAVSWQPVYFHGEIWLHGKVELQVFGFGLGLHADAKFSCDVFDPFHVKAELSVGISLPWPLPDFDVDITLEWGPTPDEPPLPMALKEIAIEHFKSTASWPLPRAELLFPNVDAGAGFLVIPPPAADMSAAPPLNAPVVPLDARPHVTFGRAVHDDALIGVNPQPVLPGAVPPGWERIGDPEQNQGPMRIRFAISEVALSRWQGATWVDEARKASDANPAGVKELYGSWAPLPQLPSGAVAPGSDPPTAQVKLWLWSKTPFDFSMHGGSAWDEWFTDTFGQYPCIPPAPERTICCDFDNIPAGTPVLLPMPCRRQREIVFVGNVNGIVQQLTQPVHGHVHGLCWDADRGGSQTTTRLLSIREAAFGIVLIGDPAGEMRLVFAGQAERSERHCFGLDDLDQTVFMFPLVIKGTSVSIFDDKGNQITHRTLRIVGNVHRGFDMGWRADITLPCATDHVDITVWQSASPVKVTGLNEAGGVVAAAQGPGQTGLVNITLLGNNIVHVIIDAPQNETTLIRVCTTCVTVGPPYVEVVAVDTNGNFSGPFVPVGDTVTVKLPLLRAVQVRGRGHVCLVEVCVTYPPSGQDVAARQDMAQRLADAMALWGDEGEVLHPYSDYRIKVVTRVEAVGEGELSGVSHTHDISELAYFKTEGPPALTTLSTPVHHPPDEAFDSGLNDLVRYVRQTVPATVPASGEQPLLPRPVYRGYDVGVEFNEDYVDLMYRIAKRDLALYLYDVNNQPVRDTLGRLIVMSNRWGVTDSVTLTESTIRYLSIIDQATCVATDPEIIPHQKTLFAVDPGLVLDPDIVYEARLIPMLLHEDFRDGLGAWTVVDSGANQGPSAWASQGHATFEGTGATAAGGVVTLAGAGDLSDVETTTDVVILATDTSRESKTYRIVAVNNAAKTVTVDGVPSLSSGNSAWEIPGSGAVVQTANIWGGNTTATDIPKPGTMLVGGELSWTDYRYSLLLRSSDDDAIGVVFRYQNADNYYRYSMDRERKYRRLVRVVGGAFTVLAEDDFIFAVNNDYLTTVEAIGSLLRVYQDGELVFEVHEDAFEAGRIGLYCWANVGARFSDVRVDDFRQSAPQAYRFSFTTSDYVDVFHHLHSFDDRTWVTESQNDAIAAEIAAAVALGTPVSDAETRAFASLVTKVLGNAAQTAPATVEVHRIVTGAGPMGLLVRSPEPIDWIRTNLSVSRAIGTVPAPAAPQDLKLTAAATSVGVANDETVTLLARRSLSLAGEVVEAYRVGGPLLDASPEVLIDDTFDRPGGVLLEEPFGSNALDRYRIVDAPSAIAGPSHWAVSGNAIVQTSNIYAGPALGASPDRPGTVAVTGGIWGDIRLTTVVRSGDNDAIGVMFRYQDDDNWYRFSMDRERSYRRLVKSVEGNVTTLWQDNVIYDQGRAYEVRIEAFGETILGHIDNRLLFVVRDGGIRAGQVGLYCWANVDAQFEGLRVESLGAQPVLFEALLNDLAELEIVDSGDQSAPSVWTAEAGEVHQTSNILGNSPPPGVLKPGTVALLQPNFGDAEISLELTSTDNDAIGVVFRYQDEGNWYRFSIDRQGGYRRLVRNVADAQSVLWQDAQLYQVGRSYSVTIRTTGSRLQGWLDGAQLFDVTDNSFTSGRIGFYAWANVGASFSGLVVTDPVRRIGDWTIVDETSNSGPSLWSSRGGALRQSSNIGEANLPNARGTLALRGSSSWSDYRINVQMRSDDDDAIGVVFRYRDADNWYRLSLDSQRSYRRLVRCEGGVLTTLWEDGDAYTVSQAFTLSIDVIGDRLVGRYGDETLFDLVDAAHAAGRIGLYVWANTGARFEHVTVTLPPLDAYAIFRDRFAAGDLASWTIVDQGAQSAPSAWGIASGALRQTSNIHSIPLDPAAIEKPGSLAVAGDSTWTDIVWTLRVRADDDDAIGFVFRYQDANHYYRFSMDHERSYRRIVRCDGGVFTKLWEDAERFELGRSYDFIIASVGSRHTLWIDGVPLAEVEDDAHDSGRIGLYVWANADARFSSVRVFNVNRLAAADLLFEDFDIAVPGLWSIVTAGTNLGPAVWEMTAGELHQSANVWGGAIDAASLGKPGTIALLTLQPGIGGTGIVPGSESWADYRVSVRLRSTDDDGIGVVFRYVDEDNWYRFSMDRERSYRRLVKCVDGNVVQLWGDAEQYILGRDYLLTIDAIGDSLVGYLDGVGVFSVRDDSLTQGTIGLYAWANVGAHFGSVRVTSAGWSAHYRFGTAEEVVAAGTKVAIHSGNEIAWSAPPTPGLTHRFIADSPDEGTLRLPASGVLDLRLRNNVSEVGHIRRFLPSGDYSNVGTARLLRQADGTSFALFAASPLPQGQYRLRFTYRRDDTAANPGSTVLSRAGDSSDEVVVLDVPWT